MGFNFRAGPHVRPVPRIGSCVLRRLVREFADHLGLSDPSKPSAISPREEIAFFPTLARRDEASGAVRLRVHGWIYQPERDSLKRAALTAALSRLFGLEDLTRYAPDAAAIFRERLAPFLVDNERAKRIAVRFADRVFVLPRSSSNGHFAAEVALDAPTVAAAESAGVLVFHAELPPGDPRRFSGRARILPEQGLSVVCDIDDTIKVSHVLSRPTLLRRTFTEPFEPVPGMADLLARLAAGPGSAVHYVSAAPWQLHAPLIAFLAEHRFPPGSLHLRAIRLKDRSLLQLFREPTEHKLAIVRRLLTTWPRRRFVLVGDSSEQDPEIYAALAREHPRRIEHVYIRDTTGESMTAGRYKRSLWAALDERWTLFADPGPLAGPGLSGPGA